MTMTLPFLDEDVERELIHRIERAREPQDRNHRERMAAIAADRCGRGMPYIGAVTSRTDVSISASPHAEPVDMFDPKVMMNLSETARLTVDPLSCSLRLWTHSPS